ncbi:MULTISPECIES: glycerol dehydratase reactivase beta/small subunit family protein [Dethiosulfovibrio]|jgi:hypothetical protein|uniref:Glycerol dehydratase reactivase beta/small subunit family protein n=2 Tax=Dethiosulfovibrio TaxID=47054 RepID=A0ABS9ELZ4_9BACT|nr:MULTISPECIES: glycerol dehydratase reactivase beta/small subunit family protein [Dethiosulfovibrio]MCF4112807.1 glycerol dehydratase reactivase beta/small subunit family protein [Dethiosulfovibrio russensis]MCF4141271.1 glycerol dehydratase reactivase beta/small subunit family protein [Dethiosulfovibrio marinus]MCF4144957.1 glycerol dehydratase reactivase beta/small subunit family protein [Dethiosulfovibrio acidaminovorans]MEA3284872.1 glycerol dehydratase reactivase beta/small subunit famil
MTSCLRIDEDDRPAIHLYVSPETEDSAVSLVAAGAEEEGIPLRWIFGKGSASDLAKEGSLSSPLQVGAGLDSQGIAVTFATYRERGAYLEESFEEFDRSLLLRWLGQAAARFVKKEPLPEWRCRSNQESDRSGEDGIEAIVAQVLKSLKRTEAMHR